jgi:hypothetical protein
MSYTPTQWKAGDTVTSAKLNKMEQGIAGGANILLVSATLHGGNPPILDKTWQEIFDADIAFVVTAEEDYKTIDYVRAIGIDEGNYIVMVGDHNYTADAADDYPVFNGGR